MIHFYILEFMFVRQVFRFVDPKSNIFFHQLLCSISGFFFVTVLNIFTQLVNIIKNGYKLKLDIEKKSFIFEQFLSFNINRTIYTRKKSDSLLKDSNRWDFIYSSKRNTENSNFKSVRRNYHFSLIFSVQILYRSWSTNRSVLSD
jgi:hypothetical protein